MPETSPSAQATNTRRKRATVAEITEAAALVDISVAIVVLGRFLPIGGAAMFVATVPLALLAMRRRLRVSLIAAGAGWLIGFLFGGYGIANVILSASVLGTIAGIGLRRKWNPITQAVITATVVGIPTALFTTGMLAAFPQMRTFMFANIENFLRALGRGLRALTFNDAGKWIDDGVADALKYWWISVPLFSMGMLVTLCLVAYFALRPIINRLSHFIGPTPFELNSVIGPHENAPIAPLPVTLHEVEMQYPGSETPAVANVSFTVTAGEFVALTGPNGAGKSTLAQVFTGQIPTGGTVTRPGSVGLGAHGGTAVIRQRPETQVLGMSVGDDLAWGGSTLTEEEKESILKQVGLSGKSTMETSALSGGQLQRLAIAAAIARRPAVLISDESTAMVDHQGREEVMETYKNLAASGTAIIHVTHHDNEIATADKIIELPSRKTTSSLAGSHDFSEEASLQSTVLANTITGGRLNLSNVHFAYDAGTPWHVHILKGINLTIEPGELVVLTGSNGAGKSTLAQIISGISTPTSGSATLDGEPIQNGRTAALFGFQYSRLQLLKSTVRADVQHAANCSPEIAAAALAQLGLAPEIYGNLRVNAISVGEQRRVALAGLLACRPRLLILDEPLAGLDSSSCTAMLKTLALVKQSGVTVVVISHDLAEISAIADRTIELNNGVTKGEQPKPEPTQANSAAHLSSTLARLLPIESPARKLWIGTKVWAVFLLAAMLVLSPSWASILVATAILVGWTILGRVPLSALPRIPWGIIIVLGIGALIAGFGGAAPVVTIFGIKFGLGGSINWALLICASIVILYSSILFTWTTPMVEFPPFAQRISRFTARFGLKIEAVVICAVLALRFLPFFIQDFGTCLQSLRQRRSSEKIGLSNRIREWFTALPVMISLAISDSRELAAAITNRGGVQTISQADRSPGWRDGIVALVLLAALFTALFLAAALR